MARISRREKHHSKLKRAIFFTFFCFWVCNDFMIAIFKISKLIARVIAFGGMKNKCSKYFEEF